MEEMEEYKAYKEAYDKMLQAFLRARFPWIVKPEDFLMLVMLTLEAATTGEPTPLTAEEAAVGLVMVNADAIAAAFDECLYIKYSPYTDFQDLKKNGNPLPNIFSREDIEEAQTIIDDLLVEEMIKHASGVALHPETIIPHQAARVWAEAFVRRLSERMKLPNPNLCEAFLANNIAKGAFMAIEC